MIYLAYFLIAVISYLLGSVNCGIIISKKFQNDDVRSHGSGNAGATNMMRNYGKIYGVITILGDMAKVGVAVLIAYYILKIFPENDSIKSFYSSVDKTIFYKSFAGLFCVMGHIFPCFFGFKGGKGVATSGGMVFIIDWRIALILLAVFFVVLLITKYVSLGSLVMAVLYPVFIFVFHKSLILTIIALIFTIIVVIAHRENIKKLANGTERKINDK